MTTLYRPVQIESAEQAEALPTDSIATYPNAFFCQKLGVNEWIDSGHAAAWSNEEMVGWTALVPIEAEEDVAIVYADEPDSAWTNEVFPSVRVAQRIVDGRPDYLPTVEVRTRYVTPWEEAS